MNYSSIGVFSDGISRQQSIPHTVSRKRTLSVCVAAALVACSSMITIEDVEAADTKKKSRNKTHKVNVVSELQAENARLREQLEQLQAAQRGSSIPATGVTPSIDSGLPATAATEPAEVVAKEEVEETKDLGEVVVRGRSRPKLAQLKEVAVSASVVGGDELKSTQSTDMGSILQRVGNIKWNPGNSRTAGLTLRGIGMVPLTDQMDSSVGYVVDGVPYSYGPMNSFDQFDVDQVEVDRGPQGTAGGKNYNMGQVNITNKQASFTNEASGSVSYGRYNTVIGDGAVGGSVVDGLLAFRAALHVNKGDGNTGNLYNPGQTWYNRDREAGRLSFLLTPTENFTAKLNMDAQPSSSEMYNGNLFYTPTPTHYANGLPNPLSTDASTRLARKWFTNELPSYSYANTYLYGAGQNAFDMNSQFPLVSNSKGISAVLDWNLGNYKLTSTTAARDYNFQAYNDEGTPFNISQNGGGSIHNFSQLSQELKVASSIGKLVDYQTGLYLLERKMDLGNTVGFGSDAGAWFASTAQYNTLYANGNGQKLMSDSLNGLITKNPNFIDNKTGALFAEAKWHITEPLTLATGMRFSDENRQNPTNKLITEQGAGASLNPVSVNGVQTGGFNSNSSGVLGANNAAQTALANAVALQYFGVSTYNPVNGVGGLTAAQRLQVGTAKALRATNIGVLWNQVPGDTYSAIQPSFNVSPSYKINEQVTAYTSYRYAQKAGFSQTVNGVSSQISPEINNAFEVGFKSALLNSDLIFNGDVFLSDIRNYQQGVSVLDSYTTNLARQSNPSAPATYTAASGNVPGVRVYGLELDGAYRGIRYTSIRFAGSYNNAKYTNFQNSAVPLELNYSGGPAYRDVNGMTLPGAAQFTFNVGPEFRIPLQMLGAEVPGNPEFHANFNTAFTSGYNSDPLLSSYGWIKANSTTDLSVGVGRRDKGFDLSFVAKNIFYNQTPGAILWNSYTLSQPQWFGFTVSAKM
jgi:outer membrane receptor protein involved in Fe transport